MEFEYLFKVIVGACVGLIISALASMNTDVTSNKVEIKNIKSNINKMSKQMDDIHWHIIRRNK